ncbi:MAG: 50S ribosomal protein L23 [Patescibacteria group bacterium]|nr:50S ribosomal protein L23 [Patescibacteria group bacterium]MDE2589719.1 50S ribosomal protein L23 [Patescibacteria group bacterium]
MTQIIVSPFITERSMALAQNGKYTFLVGRFSTKEEVKKEVERLFNVHVQKIMTVVVKGRTKRIGKRRDEIHLQPFKKAVVEVKKGEKIALFEATK